MDGYNSNVNFTDLFRELLEGVYHRCGLIYSSTEYHPLWKHAVPGYPNTGFTLVDNTAWI
jgi:hypothetical protein